MEKKQYDFLIVGAGLYGAVFANEMKKRGKSVLVIDKRSHVAGNIYTKRIDDINVHVYGAHIFHTNDKRIWDYVNKFASFNRFTNAPIAYYKGEIYSLPFNMLTFNKIWGTVTPQEALRAIEKQRVMHVSPQNLEEQAISLVGIDIYEKLIKGYTEKQWGRPCIELPAFIIKRLPLRFTYDNNYFDALFQGIPIGGYTGMVQCMLNGIEVILETDYLKNRAYWDDMADKVVFTGAIDAFFHYALGALQYRSVRFDMQVLDIDNFQGNAVVNYTDRDVPWTRIIEHKWFEFGRNEKGESIPNTIISKEFSSEWKVGNEPYYPINDTVNQELYRQYLLLAKQQPKIIFGGRLGEYRYYDMDAVIASALCKSEEIFYTLK